MNDVQMQGHHHHCHHKSISWTAVITGALVGVGLSFLLNLFSVSIGLSAFTTSTDGLSTLAVGGFIGMLIGAIVTMFITGWVAGYLGQPYCGEKNLGVLYGFTAWCFSLVLAVLLASSFGHFVTSYTAAVSNPPAAKVNMTIDDSAPIVSEQKRASGGSEVTVNTEKAANAIGATAFVTFILFFVGALSSCFGGFSGYESRRHCNESGQCKL
jgi:hypothetical protein